MTNHIETYFSAEKSGALFLIILGLVSVMPSIFALMYNLKNRFLVGFVIPVIAIGSIALITGRRVWSETDERKEALIQFADEDPAAFLAGERPRMAKVLKNFTALMAAEVFLAAAALALLLAAGRIAPAGPRRVFLKGIGAGLLLQCCIVLTFDILADNRAERYAAQIEIIQTGE